MITIKELYKEFENIIATNNINLEIRSGEIFGLVGPNGAGKTTLLRMLAANLTPTSGTAFIDEYEITKDKVEIRKMTGYMPDFFNLYRDLKIWECLDYFAEAHKIPEDSRKDRIETILETTGLTEKRNAFIKGLSRGMIQRLGLARAMLHNPKIYLLDEPFSGIDPRGRAELKSALMKLQAEGRTILISSHILPELSDFCTSIGIVERGKMISSGRISEIDKETADRKVHLTVLSDEKETEEILRKNESVLILEQKEKDFILSIKGGLPEIAELNEELVKKGVKVVSFTEKRSLEEIYLSISKEGVS